MELEEEPSLDEQVARWEQQRQEMYSYEARSMARTIAGARWPTTIDHLAPIFDQYGTQSIGTWGGYLIQIMPMALNSRIVMTPVSFPMIYDYGWCYGKGPAALLAILAWDPQTEGEPVGFKKRIGVRARTPGEQAQ